jgi:predicted Zn finger-like uncharacterized protein
MRLACPDCGATYEIDDAAIAPSGREVACSACGARWRALPEGGPEGAGAAMAEPARRPASAVGREGMRVLRAEAARERALRAATARAAVPAPEPEAEPRAVTAEAIPAAGPARTAGRAPPAPADRRRAAAARRRNRAIRLAFLGLLTAYVAALMVYLWRDDIAARSPGLAPALEDYADLFGRIFGGGDD